MSSVWHALEHTATQAELWRIAGCCEECGSPLGMERLNAQVCAECQKLAHYHERVVGNPALAPIRLKSEQLLQALIEQQQKRRLRNS